MIPTEIQALLAEYHPLHTFMTFRGENNAQNYPKGKVQKKKLKKNLTSVSFAFTHTYTAVKTNSFRFFPQAYMENFEKCAKTGNMGTLGGGWGC